MNFTFCLVFHVPILVLGTLTGSLVAQQPASPLFNSFKNFQQLRQESLLGFDWISVGPTVNSARVEAVQLHPSKPGVIYIAFGSGNLWKSTNGGMSWQPKFEQQASHGIGDFALAPSDPEVIYLGTGESLKKARNFTLPGTGVYRSDDGGDSWKHLGLADSYHIGEIAVHPTNPDIALVAVLGHFWSKNPNRGVFRTTDGGNTWQHVLDVDDCTGANDVVWCQQDPKVVYSSTWQNYPDVSGKSSSVYRSSDAGQTWRKCDEGLPSNADIGRIGLAVSSTDANKVYALVDNRAKIEAGAAEVYRSVNGGQSWERAHAQDLKIFSRIGWYFADIYVNPQDDDEIFALGVRIAHSKDGGKTFNLVGGHVTHLVPSAASGLHLDHCEMWINPQNPNHLALGNDGGFYQSFDRGNTWMHHNNLPTGEFYDVAVDMQTPYRIYAGAQDDATVYGLAQELGATRSKPWEYLWIDPWNGGDGCVTLVDPSDPDTVYFSAQEGAFRRKSMTSNRSTFIRPNLPEDIPGPLEFNFVAPMVLSPHDPRTLYLGGNYIFKSTNRGDQWNVESGNLTASAGERPQSTAVSAIAESPRVQGLLYAGTDKGALWVRESDDSSWLERSESLPIGYIRSISVSQHHNDRVYIAMSGLNEDDFGSYLFCSQDRGRTWTSIAGNLFDEPANVILEDPIHEGILYLGTFRGVYVSANGGKSWSALGREFPNCSIGDLEIQPREQDLIIATHGRGIYKVNLKPLHQFYASGGLETQSNKLHPIPAAVYPKSTDTRTGANFRGVEKVAITFCTAKSTQATLTVLDESGRSLASFEIATAAGINQFRWDLAIKNVDSQEPYFVNYTSYLGPGQYRIRLELPGADPMEQVLNVYEK